MKQYTTVEKTPQLFSHAHKVVKASDSHFQPQLLSDLCNQGDDSRVIQQFHYISWPDHGVPNDTAGFVSFCDKIRDNTRHIDGPLLVHCR